MLSHQYICDNQYSNYSIFIVFNAPLFSDILEKQNLST